MSATKRRGARTRLSGPDANPAEPALNWPGDPETVTAADIDFRAVARVLANTCRHGGRIAAYHSLAGHAVLTSAEVEALDGLASGGPPGPGAARAARRRALCVDRGLAPGCAGGIAAGGGTGEPSRGPHRARCARGGRARSGAGGGPRRGTAFRRPHGGGGRAPRPRRRRRRRAGDRVPAAEIPHPAAGAGPGGKAVAGALRGACPPAGRFRRRGAETNRNNP